MNGRPLGLMMILSAATALGQPFQNLDFEMAVIEEPSWLPREVPITNALPFWQGVLDGYPLVEVLYETASLDWAALLLLHEKSALFGNYSAALQESAGFGSWIVELAQTGFVPPDAKSIHFYTSRHPFIPSPNSTLRPEDYDFSFKLNVQKVSVSPIAVDPIAVLWAGDVSNVAGTVAEIRWSMVRTAAAARPPGVAPVSATVALDNISFSPEPVFNILARPLQDQSTYVGASVHFEAATIAPGTYTYQWLFNGEVMAGQTNSSLDLKNVQSNQAGSYAVKISNELGTLTSPNATLAVSTIATWDYILPPPSNLSNVVAIAAGAYHAVALTDDGSVVVWGNNYYGQLNVPPGLSNVVAIAAGSIHSLALKSDGTVVAWAWGGGITPNGQSAVPGGLNDVVAITGGSTVSVALKSDGTVVGWGGDFSGSAALPPIGLANVVAIGVGAYHGVALRADGTVVAWGDNRYGQAIVPSGLSNVVAVACGDFHSLALKSDGSMIAWGENYAGQTNVPVGLSNVVAIAAGSAHNLALTSDGVVFCWGSQTHVPLGLTNVIAISAGASSTFSMALIGTSPPGYRVFLEHPRRIASSFSVDIASARGRVYQLEYGDALPETLWKALPLVVGKGAKLMLTDPSPAEAQRFYRVRQW